LIKKREAAKTMQLIMSNPTEREMIRMRQDAQSDWTTTVNGSVSHECIRAGNDLIMPGMQHDHDEISAALDSGALTEEELDRCALRIIHLAHRLNR